MHTAQHLVELALRDFSGPIATFCDWGTVDEAAVVVTGLRDPVDTDAVQLWLEAIVNNDLPMSTTQSATAPFGQVWYLDGVGHRHCAALHLSSSAELGAVTLTSKAISGDRTLLTVSLLT